MTETVDLLVIGGGVNGAGIARDAAGRGLSVVLCEKDDLAEGTSSRSGKLVHGGLRYLEYYEFRLVREALIEREVLLQRRAAYHLADALRAAARPRIGRPGWCGSACFFTIISAAASICRRRARSILRRDPEGAPIKTGIPKAFEYSDCWVDDARLVVLNARRRQRSAARRSSPAPPASRRARENGAWRVEMKDTRDRRASASSRRAPRQRQRAVGQRRDRARRRRQFAAHRAARQGQPHHHAESSGTGRKPIWCRTTTSA